MIGPEKPSPARNRVAVLRRLVCGLLRLGAATAKGVMLGSAVVVTSFLAVVGAIQGGVAAIACLLLIAAAAAAIAYECEARRGQVPLSTAQRRTLAGWAVLAGVAVLTVTGAAEVAGMPVGELVAAFAAMAAFRRARRRLAEPTQPVEPPPLAEAVEPAKVLPMRPTSLPIVLALPGEDVRLVPRTEWQLDRRETAEVVLAWRHSYLLLAACRDDPIRLAQLSEQRRAYLDELARRDPVGFRRWMDSGARAAGDPSRYLNLDPRSGGWSA